MLRNLAFAAIATAMAGSMLYSSDASAWDFGTSRFVRTNMFVQPGIRQGLNPQPLPPKTFSSTFMQLGTRQGLNPQPLPPKIFGR